MMMDNEIEVARPFCPAVTLDSEDPLFILYTSGKEPNDKKIVQHSCHNTKHFGNSGSTGKPKGIQHSQAGYILSAMLTLK